MRPPSAQRRRWAGGLVLLVATTTSAVARPFPTVEEALHLAFSGCTIERRTVFLTAAQLARARQLAGAPVASAIVHPYAATCAGKPGGRAYFDVHRVRTLPETLMVVLAADGSVRRLEVLAFDEPAEYLPPPAWYEQFAGRRLDEELGMGRAIRGVTGATLTARSTTAAVRRVLALDRVVTEGAVP